MIWIQYWAQATQQIPAELICNGVESLANNNGYTALDLWISYTQFEIPHELKYYNW